MEECKVNHPTVTILNWPLDGSTSIENEKICIWKTTVDENGTKQDMGKEQDKTKEYDLVK